jgi:hypothetical protein
VAINFKDGINSNFVSITIHKQAVTLGCEFGSNLSLIPPDSDQRSAAIVVVLVVIVGAFVIDVLL